MFTGFISCLLYLLLGAIAGWLTLNYVLPNQIIDDIEDGQDNLALLAVITLWLLWPIIIPAILLLEIWEYITNWGKD